MTDTDVKSCCAALYEGEWVRALLGESFHPGGLDLTRRLGGLLELGPGTRVLDVASGRGTSAVALAETFGCEVVGTDLSAEMVARANETAPPGVRFVVGDAEGLPFEDAGFDAVVSECAFCTFPDKARAAAEFARVLRPGGRIGLSDLTRRGALPPELETLLAWVACIADALPAESYVAHLEAVGCAGVTVEPHDEALAQMVRDIRGRLVGARLMSGLGQIALPEGVDLDEALRIARSAAEAIGERRLGYALFVGQTAA